MPPADDWPTGIPIPAAENKRASWPWVAPGDVDAQAQLADRTEAARTGIPARLAAIKRSAESDQ